MFRIWKESLLWNFEYNIYNLSQKLHVRDSIQTFSKKQTSFMQTWYFFLTENHVCSCKSKFGELFKGHLCLILCNLYWIWTILIEKLEERVETLIFHVKTPNIKCLKTWMDGFMSIPLFFFLSSNKNNIPLFPYVPNSFIQIYS